MLERTDKWYLGSAGAALWAPPFPRFLDRPGFWDRAHLYRYPLEPVFGVAVLDERGREIVPRAEGQRAWQPGELAQRYVAPGQLEMAETRAITPGDCLVSLLELRNGATRPRRLRVALWTCQAADGLEAARAEGAEAWFVRRPKLWDLPSPTISVALGLQVSGNGAARAWRLPAEHATPGPEWSHSPLSEREQAGEPAQPENEQAANVPAGALFVHLAVVAEVELARGESRSVVCAAALALELDLARARLRRTLEPGHDVLRATRRSWERYFASVPQFHCSDPFLETAYWYRWYGLRLLTIDAPALNYPAGVVCEGIDSFRAPISYSAQCHLREVRWMRSPSLGQGILRTFARNQREDGSMPGYIPPQGELPHTFYHADWGGAALALHRVHPDGAFLSELYPALVRYAEYLQGPRDPDRAGLCEVWNHYETGQEYMSRYLFADPAADREDWGSVFRLYGVDASVYAYQTFRALAVMAAELGRLDGAARWTAAAERTGEAIRERLWHPELRMFVDALPGTFERSSAKAAVGFYPFMTDLAGPEHLDAIRQHLLNPAEFWTPFPVPSSSVDDPLFSAEGIWRGVRRNCPWNGRVWPMANSHVAEALFQAAERLDPGLAPHAADFLHRFARLLCWDQDPSRPNCFEHYHPYTGQPSAYRGIDDYQHSWLVDLIIRYVCGLRPDGEELEVRPFPMGLDWFSLEGAPWRGYEVSVEWRAGEELRVWVDGKLNRAECETRGSAEGGSSGNDVDPA